MNLTEITKEIRKTVPSVTEDQVHSVLEESQIEEKLVDQKMISLIIQRLQAGLEKTKQVIPAPQKPSSQLATVTPAVKKSKQAIASVEDANRKQQEAAASLATAGAVAQTEFIEAVHICAAELREQVFTPQKIKAAAEMLVKQQNAAIDEVMSFLSRTTEGTARQIVSDIKEASGVEVLDAEVV